MEAVTNWHFAQALRAALARYDVNVLMTHEGANTALAKPGDLAGELKARAAVANNVLPLHTKADLLVSTHHDAAGNPEARGGSVYVWTSKGDWLDAEANHTDPKSYPLALTIYPFVKDALATFGVPWRGTVMCSDFGILRNTVGPAILFELFFGTSPDDVAAARKVSFIPTVATALAEGIAQALGLAAKKPRAKDAVTVLYKGVEVDCGGKLESGTTRVDLRAFAEATGKTVSYDERTRTVSVS